MAKIFIKPAVAGQVIRHPEKMHHIISQDGEFVEDNVFWTRKLAQGDIVLCDQPQAEEIKKPALKPKPNKEGELS